VNANKILYLAAVVLAPHITTWAEDTSKCTRDAAIAAETQSTPNSWRDLYKSFRRYVRCDDGAVAEVFSSSVALLLSEHWDTIGDLNTLAKAHPTFGSFVLRHTDVTMSLDQAKAIKGNAQERCPVDSRDLCDRILHRMREFK
jgi:hypothetical protein